MCLKEESSKWKTELYYLKFELRENGYNSVYHTK